MKSLGQAFLCSFDRQRPYGQSADCLWFNDYCVEHPLLLGWPTMYIWLEFWFLVMIADFIIAAYKLKAWDCRQDQKPIVPVQRPEL